MVMDGSSDTRPVMIGIVGPSAGGKTTLAEGVAEILGRDRVAMVCVDDYHRLNRAERLEMGISALDPRANYMDVMQQDLYSLRRGRAILKPVYDHETGTIGPSEYLAPEQFIIVYGLLAYATQRLRECFDVKVFLEPDEDLRIAWKTLRDVAKRGYTRDEVMAQIEIRSQDRYGHVLPQRAFADVVIEFVVDDDTTQSPGELSVRHTLRPTLPHPDFSSILDDDSARGDVWGELTRDIDSKPIDVLHISGDISDERARALESLLWSQMAESFRVHVDAGEYFDGTRKQTSHTLGFAQMLVAYHAVMARQRTREP